MVIFQASRSATTPTSSASTTSPLDRERRVRLPGGPLRLRQVAFIRLLLKEFDPTEGTITVGGRNLNHLRRSKVPYLRRAISCVFQDFKLLAGRTVYDNVAYALQVIGENPRSTRRKVPEILTLVGLSDKGDRYPNELSGGEQQRVSIRAQFVNHPRLLIADEPTGNLDPETSIHAAALPHQPHRRRSSWPRTTARWSTRCRCRSWELEDGGVVRDQREAATPASTTSAS